MATNDQDYGDHGQQQSGAFTGYASAGRRLDMLTESDLRRIIREELDAMLPHAVGCPRRVTQASPCTCRNR